MALASGTVFYPACVGGAIDEDVLDITAIPKLRGIAAHDADWRIGATTCAYHTPYPAIFMVEAAADGPCGDLTKPLNGTTDRRIRRCEAMHCAEVRALLDLYVGRRLVFL